MTRKSEITRNEGPGFRKFRPDEKVIGPAWGDGHGNWYKKVDDPEQSAATGSSAYRCDLRCPGCNMNWWMFPPVHVHGLPLVRCIGCKRIYDERAENV